MTTTAVDIYIKQNCPFCVRAEKLLNKRQISYTRIDVTEDTDRFDAMIERAGGRRTVPQIFVGDRHIGGCDDLSMMPRADFMALVGQT